MEFEEDSEEPSDGEEFYENDDNEDNEAEVIHQPKVGSGLPLPGGLPRPPNPANASTKAGAITDMNSTLDPANRSARGSEFRIKHNTSKGSLGATAGNATYVNPAKKTTRPSLIGMNKPNMLKNQNEDIKRMLGMADTEPEKGDDGRADRKGGPGTRLKPVVR